MLLLFFLLVAESYWLYLCMYKLPIIILWFTKQSSGRLNFALNDFALSSTTLWKKYSYKLCKLINTLILIKKKSILYTYPFRYFILKENIGSIKEKNTRWGVKIY